MTSLERVLAALSFRRGDRVPRFINFWPEFADTWRAAGSGRENADICRHYGSDIRVVVADETAWPTTARILEESSAEVVRRTGWGVIERVIAGGHFSQCLQTSVPQRVDPATLIFDDPRLDSRYDGAVRAAEGFQAEGLAVFCKTGGPYLRAAHMRGQEAFLTDLAEDPAWAQAMIDRVVDHITQVGVESLRRCGLEVPMIGIYDDVCDSRGPVMGPGRYQRMFLPALRRMVQAYRRAGAVKVLHHCDGDVRGLLDMWVDAGIDAVHPLEARLGIDPVQVRATYDGRLAIVGALDNSRILPRGDREEIRRHVLHVLSAGRDGGLIVSPHSIGPDVSLKTMDYVAELLDAHGAYPLDLPGEFTSGPARS